MQKFNMHYYLTFVVNISCLRQLIRKWEWYIRQGMWQLWNHIFNAIQHMTSKNGSDIGTRVFCPFWLMCEMGGCESNSHYIYIVFSICYWHKCTVIVFLIEHICSYGMCNNQWQKAYLQERIEIMYSQFSLNSVQFTLFQT